MEAGSRPGGWLTQNQNRRSALLAVSTFVLIFLIALGSRRSFGVVGASGDGSGLRLTWAVLYFSTLGVLAVGVVVLAYVLLSGVGRRGKKSPEHAGAPAAPWWAQVLALLFLVALAASVAAIFILLQTDGEDVGTVPVGPSPATPLGQGGGLGEQISNSAVGWSFSGGLAAAVLVLGWFSARRVWRRRRQSAVVLSQLTPASGRCELRDVVVASLDDLEREPDARLAVIRAYAAMEGVLAERGLGRRPHEAPLEYLHRWLTSLGISRSAGERLTVLFQRARFSDHAVDIRMKRDAVEALSALRHELAGEDR
ncbi:MAG: DUF4129 domain-containing protein [Thermoleophilia bacterium]|nr:DUF4129 domain-containing protein [Thermoleophilia bacterium]